MSFSKQLIVFLSLAFMATQAVMACDPTITTDFGLTGNVTGKNFTSTSYEPGNLPKPNSGLQLIPNFVAQYPGVTGLSVSSVYFIIGPGAEVPPHSHPRATEIFFVITGTWSVGFIDTNNILYSAQLGPGDQFIFPIGLLHYQYVTGILTGTGISFFNSQNPGVAITATSLFNSTAHVPAQVLANAFKISLAEVATIEAAQAA